jgi:hypothetical protein
VREDPVTDPKDPDARTDPTDPNDPNDPNDLGDLDLGQFVGDPPAGDAHPGDFVSSDQSSPAGTDEPEQPTEEER